jgi:diguanylate cyclase
MPLNYELDTHLKVLEAVLDDYTGWFLQVTRRVFYPLDDHSGMNNKGGVFVYPPSFESWVKETEKTGSMPPHALKALRELHRDLCSRAELLINGSVKSRLPPPHSEYQKLTVLFEEFTGRIRRQEKDQLLGDSGIDTLTGLRSKDAMEKDIKREMDRLARQGKTFALALVRLDNYDVMRAEMPEQEMNAAIKTVAELVKKSMRSFDDAYRIDNGMFVLSLKQTGTTGGIKALKRLKTELDKSKASYKLKGKETLMTLSSCIGEPSDGEDITAFLENLKKDLDAYNNNKGSVVEYFELSPLQRFIRDQEQGKG